MQKRFDDNVKLVYSVYHKKIEPLSNAKSMEDDLIQIGMLTLWKCCKQFDESKGVKFSTYAYMSIQKNMMCALARENKKTAYLVSVNIPVECKSDESSIVLEEVLASPINISSQIELEMIIEQLTDEMGEKCKMIIDYVLEGYSQKEISDRMDITKAYVNKILKKFRKKLKNTLFVEYNMNMEVETNE